MNATTQTSRRPMTVPAPAAGRIRVLLVEPRSTFAIAIAIALGDQLFAVEVVPSEVAALESLLTGDPGVVLACIGSHRRGVEMFDRLRAVCRPHVIALTDRDLSPTGSDVRRNDPGDTTQEVPQRWHEKSRTANGLGVETIWEAV